MKLFFDKLDQSLADELDVSLEDYIEVVENRATEEEATTIVVGLFSEDLKEQEKAKELFYKKLNNK